MITIENLSFAFTKGEPVFTGLNMKLHSGRTYGLFGLNGAGKTTLLNHLSGMLFPAEGDCLIDGKSTGRRLPETMSELYLLPEQFDLPPIHPGSFIDLHAPFYPRFDREQMDEIMQQFELNRTKKLSEQSYGQRKKFLISFGLAANTQILLMDEPTNGLDIPSKSRFRKIMASTDRGDRCTVISTHQVRDLETLIDRITVLHRGSIIFDHTIEEISRHLTFKKVQGHERSDRIYGEDILGGEYLIRKRRASDPDTPVDLELLFNGTIEDSESLNRVFQDGDSL